MKLINFVAFLVSTKYFVAADLGNANSIFDYNLVKSILDAQEYVIMMCSFFDTYHHDSF